MRNGCLILFSSASAPHAAPDIVGKTVQAKGKVTEVCDIVFPKDSVGKIAIAKGVLTKHELARAQTIAKARHEAEEQGRKFDPASIKSGTTDYEIAGTGAVITE